MKMTINLPLSPVLRKRIRDCIRNDALEVVSLEVANQILLADLVANISVSNVDSIVLEDGDVLWFTKMFVKQ